MSKIINMDDLKLRAEQRFEELLVAHGYQITSVAEFEANASIEEETKSQLVGPHGDYLIYSDGHILFTGHNRAALARYAVIHLKLGKRPIWG